MTWMWIVGGVAGGLFGVWLMLRQYKRGILAEAESADKSTYIKSELEAERQAREAEDAAKAARDRAGADPLDWS